MNSAIPEEVAKMYVDVIIASFPPDSSAINVVIGYIKACGTLNSKKPKRNTVKLPALPMIRNEAKREAKPMTSRSRKCLGSDLVKSTLIIVETVKTAAKSASTSGGRRFETWTLRRFLRKRSISAIASSRGSSGCRSSRRLSA